MLCCMLLLLVNPTDVRLTEEPVGSESPSSESTDFTSFNVL